MGHVQEMTEDQKRRFFADKYQKLKESRRGDSFEYWNDEKHGLMLENGWALWDFATLSVLQAKEKVVELRKSGHYARIVCGYQKSKQRERYCSVIYRKK
jgi:hypothetical protein